MAITLLLQLPDCAPFTFNICNRHPPTKYLVVSMNFSATIFRLSILLQADKNRTSYYRMECVVALILCAIRF